MVFLRFGVEKGVRDATMHDAVALTIEHLGGLEISSVFLIIAVLLFLDGDGIRRSVPGFGRPHFRDGREDGSATKRVVHGYMCRDSEFKW
jgi:hypothetical protein